MHRKLKQVSAHLRTHTYTHTRVRAWHGPGTAGGAPRHMRTHGWTDRRQSPSPRATVPPGARGTEEGSLGPRAACERAPGLVPGGRPRAAQRGRRSASPGSSQAAPDAPGFAGLPAAPSTLGVSVPPGGKYKRCLCLKPNVGGRESPGLGPSSGHGSWPEGRAETREAGLHRAPSRRRGAVPAAGAARGGGA